MQTRPTESLWGRCWSGTTSFCRKAGSVIKKTVSVVKKGVKWGIIVPNVITAAVVVLAARNLFSNQKAAEELFETPNPNDADLLIMAITFTAGTVIGTVPRIWSIIKYCRGNPTPKKKNTEEISESKKPADNSHDPVLETADQLENQGPEADTPPDSLPVAADQIGNTVAESKAEETQELLADDEETCCEACGNDYCSCSRRCLSSHMAFWFKRLCSTNILTTCIIAGNLGMVTIFRTIRGQSAPEFLNDESSLGQFLQVMTWVLPIEFALNYLAYNLNFLTYPRIDKMKEAVQTKEYDLTGANLAFTMLLASPCILSSPFGTYFNLTSSFENFVFFKNLFEAGIKPIAIIFSAINLPITAIMLFPSAHDFVATFRADPSKSFRERLGMVFEVPYYYSERLDYLTCGLASNPLRIVSRVLIVANILDSGCTLLNTEIGTKCTFYDLGWGVDTSVDMHQSTALTACPTVLPVKIFAWGAGLSTQFLMFSLSAYGVKKFCKEMSEQTPFVLEEVLDEKLRMLPPPLRKIVAQYYSDENIQKTKPTQLKGPGNNSMFAESKKPRETDRLLGNARNDTIPYAATVITIKPQQSASGSSRRPSLFPNGNGYQRLDEAKHANGTNGYTVTAPGGPIVAHSSPGSSPRSNLGRKSSED